VECKWIPFYSVLCSTLKPKKGEQQKGVTKMKGIYQGLNGYIKMYIVNIVFVKQVTVFLISDFRHVLNVIFVLLGDSLVSEFYVPTFQNTLLVLSS